MFVGDPSRRNCFCTVKQGADLLQMCFHAHLPASSRFLNRWLAVPRPFDVSIHAIIESMPSEMAELTRQGAQR